MAYFEFPHTRNYDGDLGFVIKKIIELTDRYNEFFEYNSITFADPLQWDITKQYPAYQIVFDYDSGYSYISKRPVPAGVTLANPAYWCLVGPLIVDAQARTEIQTILQFIANIYESGTTASAVRTAGEYVVVNGSLYKTTTTINAGETYTSGINITPITIEDMIHEIISSDLGSTITNIQNDITNLDNRVDKLEEEPFTILIGDSYGEGYDPGGNNDGWCAYLLAKGIRGISTYVGGSGFYLAPSNVKAPQYLLDQITLPTGVTAADVKRIVCCIGYNDFKQTNSDIIANIKTFVTHCNTNYPNAQVYIGMCGYAWTQNADSIIGQHISNTLSAYKDGCAQTTAVFMNQTTAVILGVNGLSTTDYKHPNATGNKAIADAIYAALHGQSFRTAYTYTFSGLTNTSIQLTAELSMRVSIKDGVINGYGRYNNFEMDDTNAHNIHTLYLTPGHFPCMPYTRWHIANYFNNQSPGSSLGKAYYSAPIYVDMTYFDARLSTIIEVINDTGDNFATAKHITINDSSYNNFTSEF